MAKIFGPKKPTGAILWDLGILFLEANLKTGRSWRILKKFERIEKQEDKVFKEIKEKNRPPKVLGEEAGDLIGKRCLARQHLREQYEKILKDLKLAEKTIVFLNKRLKKGRP